VRRFLDARGERAAGRATAQRPDRGGAACSCGVHCPCFCSLIVKRTRTFFPSASHPIWRPRKKCGGGGGGVKNPRCEAATICGGRPGLLSMANDAVAASQPMNEIS